jgi:hypothetical protein|tara:strand:+ start:490 stop:684 length:195 start_codon:yes stop_codon:yes gene_type:complete
MAYPDQVARLEARREQLNYERHNYPSREFVAGNDYVTLYYSDGKIVRQYLDKRKKDEVIKEAWC